jgi:hypothetical protein
VKQQSPGHPSLSFLYQSSIGAGICFAFAAWSQAQIREALAKFTAAFEEERLLKRR